MCPDAGLLSAYADGEVPSPWKERIEAHLSSCPACAAKVAEYRRLGAALSGEALAGDAASGHGRAGFDAEASAARVRERLGSLLDRPLAPAQSASTKRTPRGGGAGGRLWGRSIALPLPAAAAAAAAILVLAGMALSGLFKPARAPVQTLAAAEIRPTKAEGQNMEALINYLQSQDAQLSLTIQLPSGATFDGSGKPLVVKAEPSDYVPLGGSAGGASSGEITIPAGGQQ